MVEKSKKLIERDKKRKKGYEKWLKKYRKEKEKEKKKKEKLKEKEKKKKEKERLKSLNKKKVGRPKKRGPKKKRKKKELPKEKHYVKYDYKIVECHNGKQIGYIGKYFDLEIAYSELNQLIEENKNIIFPRKITTSSSLKQESINEYLLLEKNRDFNKPNPLMRNKYGKLIEQRLNSEKWVILDKFQYNVEETFWVYGYHPNIERKTFQWVYDNLIISQIEGQSENILRIILYKNKILIKNDENKYEMILCKNISDAIRFYNLLEEKIKKDGYINVFFLGSYNIISEKRRKLEEDLIKMTGWDKYKIQKSTTTKSKSK